MGFFARIAITAFGLWVADLLLAGLYFDGFWPLVLAAALLGVVNAIVRPIVIVLTLPITFLTLGLFLLVINGAMVLLVGRLMDTVHIQGLGTGVLTAIIVGLTSLFGNRYIGEKKRD